MTKYGQKGPKGFKRIQKDSNRVQKIKYVQICSKESKRSKRVQKDSNRVKYRQNEPKGFKKGQIGLNIDKINQKGSKRSKRIKYDQIRSKGSKRSNFRFL